MTARLVVWREAGNYGPVGMFTPQEDLGTYTFPQVPERGQIVEARGQEWIVTEVFLGYIHVKPRVMRPVF